MWTLMRGQMKRLGGSMKQGSGFVIMVYMIGRSVSTRHATPHVLMIITPHLINANAESSPTAASQVPLPRLMT